MYIICIYVYVAINLVYITLFGFTSIQERRGRSLVQHAGATWIEKDAQLASIRLHGRIYIQQAGFIADLRGKGFNGCGLELALKSAASFPSPLQLSLVDVHPCAVSLGHTEQNDMAGGQLAGFHHVRSG